MPIPRLRPIPVSTCFALLSKTSIGQTSRLNSCTGPWLGHQWIRKDKLARSIYDSPVENFSALYLFSNLLNNFLQQPISSVFSSRSRILLLLKWTLVESNLTSGRYDVSPSILEILACLVAPACLVIGSRALPAIRQLTQLVFVISTQPPRNVSLDIDRLAK